MNLIEKTWHINDCVFAVNPVSSARHSIAKNDRTSGIQGYNNGSEFGDSADPQQKPGCLLMCCD